MTTITAGTVFFRIHSSRYAPEAFNPSLSHRYFGGGRFDATLDDEYSYMYLGSSVGVALAETLLRDLPLNDRNTRRLPRAAYRERSLSALQLRTDIECLELRSSEDLGWCGQDSWLTQAAGTQYAQTRHWCHWMRSHATSAAAFSWVSRRDPAGAAYVLFGDRVPIGGLVGVDHPDAPRDGRGDFATREGRLHLRSHLERHGVSITVS